MTTPDSKRKDKRKAKPNYLRFIDVPPVLEREHGLTRSVPSIYRWHDPGLRGVRLRTAFWDGATCTTPEWIAEFLEAVATAHESPIGERCAAGAPP